MIKKVLSTVILLGCLFFPSCQGKPGNKDSVSRIPPQLVAIIDTSYEVKSLRSINKSDALVPYFSFVEFNNVATLAIKLENQLQILGVENQATLTRTYYGPGKIIEFINNIHGKNLEFSFKLVYADNSVFQVTMILTESVSNLFDGVVSSSSNGRISFQRTRYHISRAGK